MRSQITKAKDHVGKLNSPITLGKGGDSAPDFFLDTGPAVLEELQDLGAKTYEPEGDCAKEQFQLV